MRVVVFDMYRGVFVKHFAVGVVLLVQTINSQDGQYPSPESVLLKEYVQIAHINTTLCRLKENTVKIQFWGRGMMGTESGGSCTKR